MARNQKTTVPQEDQGEERVMAMTLRLQKPMWRAVKRRAIDETTSAQQVITNAITAYLEAEKSSAA